MRPLVDRPLVRPGRQQPSRPTCRVRACRGRNPVVLASLILLFMAGLAGLAGRQARAQTDPTERVEACVLQEMSGKGVHGAQLAVMRDGEMVFERAYGRKHRDRSDPVDIHSQFRIGSTTKALTAVAMMQLVDAGRLGLDAPITDYLTDFALAEPGQAEAITTRHLLTHSSGLHDTSAMVEADLEGEQDPGAMRRWVDKQRGQQPYAPPGRFWNYSSGNYMYAGQILERITGQSYQDYMDQQVFAPAGMSDSTMQAAAAVARGNFAFGHYNNPFTGQLDIYTLDDANNWARHPTGYANATAGDLVHFATLLMAGGGDLLSGASTAAMQARQQHRDLRVDQYYGYGTFVEYFQGNEMVHHDGGAWGWTATLKWIPDAGVAVATTANIGGALLTGATECALSAYVRPGTGGPSNPCRQDRASWDDWVGTYQGSRNNGDPWTFDVTRSSPGGDLQLQLSRPGAEDSLHALSQNCGLWISDGPGTFDASGLGRITFIQDPVEPDRAWLRNRFFAGGMRREAAPTATSTRAPTDTPSPESTAEASATPVPERLYLPRLERD